MAKGARLEAKVLQALFALGDTATACATQRHLVRAGLDVDEEAARVCLHGLVRMGAVSRCSRGFQLVGGEGSNARDPWTMLTLDLLKQAPASLADLATGLDRAEQDVRESINSLRQDFLIEPAGVDVWAATDPARAEELLSEAERIFGALRDLVDELASLAPDGMGEDVVAQGRRVIENFDWEDAESRDIGTLLVLGRTSSRVFDDGSCEFDVCASEIIDRHADDQTYVELWEYLETAAEYLSEPAGASGAGSTATVVAEEGADATG